MLHAWWNRNMDARRSVSLLLAVAGCAVAAIGMAATPVSLVFPSNYGVAVGPVLGAALGGYLRYRVSDPERAPLWALAYGASVVAILVATFGTAVVIRPTVLGIPGLGDAWSGLIVSGFLGMCVGAFLWERDARTRRFAALALLAVWLIVAGVFASMSGDPWASLAAPVSLSGFVVFLLAFVVGRPTSGQDAAKPAGGGSARRPRTDPLLVMLLVAITTELLAGLGFALGIQPAGSLGMITGSLLTLTAVALVIRRQPNRPAARRIYLGLVGCVGVTASVLLVSSALNAMAVGVFLGPLCGMVVLVALMAQRGHSGQYVVTWGFLGESRSDPTRP